MIAAERKTMKGFNLFKSGYLQKKCGLSNDIELSFG
jgi:hypothetical protein